MWTKICGITDPNIAAQIAELGPNGIGLNFYAKSPRSVSVEVAKEIVRSLPVTVTPIGLFVNHSLAEISTITSATGIKTLQLHGDETPDLLKQLSEYELIKAFRVDETGLGAVAVYLNQLNQLGVKLSKCLVDARVDGAYGGTGHTAPWELLAREWNHSDWPPLVVAGGLNETNVAAAIRAARPYGVDVASGVEDSPGRQNIEKVQQFLNEARGSR